MGSKRKAAPPRAKSPSKPDDDVLVARLRQAVDATRQAFNHVQDGDWIMLPGASLFGPEDAAAVRAIGFNMLIARGRVSIDQARLPAAETEKAQAMLDQIRPRMAALWQRLRELHDVAGQVASRAAMAESTIKELIDLRRMIDAMMVNRWQLDTTSLSTAMLAAVAATDAWHLRGRSTKQRRRSSHASGTLDERALALGKRWQLDPNKCDNWMVTEVADALGTHSSSLIGKARGKPRCPLFHEFWNGVKLLRDAQKMEGQQRALERSGVPRARRQRSE